MKWPLFVIPFIQFEQNYCKRCLGIGALSYCSIDDLQWPLNCSTPLSPKYRQIWQSKRQPLVVCLPGMFPWVIDTISTNPNEKEGWIINGEPPIITVQPSINITGLYHGWIKNGIISDDVEGRLYDSNGFLIRKIQS